MNKNDIDKLLHDLRLNDIEPEFAKILKEVECNEKYIYDVQLPKLVKLHDVHFTKECLKPARRLLEKYSNIAIDNGTEIQREAELIDRDMRVIEETLDLVRQNKARDK